MLPKKRLGSHADKGGIIVPWPIAFSPQLDQHEEEDRRAEADADAERRPAALRARGQRVPRRATTRQVTGSASLRDKPHLQAVSRSSPSAPFNGCSAAARRSAARPACADGELHRRLGEARVARAVEAEGEIAHRVVRRAGSRPGGSIASRRCPHGPARRDDYRLEESMLTPRRSISMTSMTRRSIAKVPDLETRPRAPSRAKSERILPGRVLVLLEDLVGAAGRSGHRHQLAEPEREHHDQRGRGEDLEHHPVEADAVFAAAISECRGEAADREHRREEHGRRQHQEH